MASKSIKVTLPRRERMAIYILKKENKLDCFFEKLVEERYKKVFGKLPEYPPELQDNEPKRIKMRKHKSFWDTKTTIHTPMKEKDVFILDLLAEKYNLKRQEVIEKALYQLPEFQEELKRNEFKEL